MDAFKVAHIATEIAVIGAVYVVLKNKVNAEKAERELLAQRVQKLEEMSKQQMDALKILYSKLEKQQGKFESESLRKKIEKRFEPLKKLYSDEEPKKHTRGAGVYATEADHQQQEEEPSSDYQSLEEDFETPEFGIGSSNMEDTD
uniref:Transmembrane domain containing protein n=1 Tax=Marseillevirus sp. TaxID=2809551 RepID=A0AA96IXK3_9VIRU|nr:transmembrane domain containing protein [Marseillevirus sp.]